MNVAERIYTLRKERGLSQEQLAEIAGVSRQAISKWESEQSAPEIDKIILMSEYFGVSTDYILKGSEPKRRNRQDWSRKLTILGTCSNFIGLVILFFDARAIWGVRVFSMDPVMIIPKAIAAICMIIGSTLFLLSEEKTTNTKVRKFLRLNIFAYAGLGAMIIYVIGTPSAWPYIFYVLCVLVTEIVLIAKKPK